MDSPIRIPNTRPTYKSQDYAFLREEGLKIVREIAGTTWTDHNIHDPGITLLEAMCYSLTEVGLRMGMDMADLLTSGEEFAPQEFFTASQVLPVSPVTTIDFQKVLLDHPLVRNGWVSKIPRLPNGQLNVLLEFSDDALNTNIFSLLISPPGLGSTYRVDLAFPYWDEPDVRSFQENVEILNASFSHSWQPLKSGNAQFASITLDYQPITGPADSLELWLVLQVTSPLENVLVELPEILQEVENVLLTAPNENILKAYNNRIINAHVAMRSVQAYIRDYRNLCEDFTEFKAVRLQEIAFSAILEISSGVDVEALLANIFFAVDQHLSPPITINSLGSLQGKSMDSTLIYEGPLLAEGFLQTEELLSHQALSKIYTSDILRLIFQQRNSDRTDVLNRENTTNRKIIALRNLSLSNWLDNHAITKGAKDCLQLVDSRRHVPRLSTAKCQIDIIRNGVKINYDFARAEEIFEGYKEKQAQSLMPGSEDLPLPEGNTLPLRDYYPLQNELPVVFGVGEYGLSAHALPERKALAKQLKGYLFFYEQLLAGQFSQLSQLNAVFSADPELHTTVFHQTLYHLPMASDLFGYENHSPGWENFQADEGNSYVESLTSAEPREKFLDRRNRLLDHLIARLGEDMQEYAEMVVQESMRIPGAVEMDLDHLFHVQQEKYLDAMEFLVKNKAAFYYDLPLLNRDRFQAYGNLLWRLEAAINLQESPLGYNWQILDYNQVPILEGLNVFSSRIDAEQNAAFSLKLATSAANYEISPAAGFFFLILRQTPDGEPLARSVQSANSEALAESLRDLLSQSMIQKWLEFTLIPLERRLYHFLGLRTRQRRLLVIPLNEYFEIFDEVDADPLVEKRFRLRELPGAAGDILLQSVANYEGPDDLTATENALRGIETLLDAGTKAENYILEENSPSQFQVALQSAEGNTLARSVSVFPDLRAAQQEIVRVKDHLYRYYGREGFYLIENFLLAPKDTSAPGLDLTESTLEPYSFQLGFIFPSGYSRDFSDPTSVRQADQPSRFREEEFRRYAERTIRKACPAHILARIRWVDTMRRGTVISGDVPCFDLFEQRYRAWLAVYLSDSPDAATLETLRVNLVTCLNAIYQETI